MKRRLDLALALATGPPSSSWTSRQPASTRRAERRSGRRSPAWRETIDVTVFLTTQYLEEADVLADRVGIIDHGKIVAEGTPSSLKAEIGRPTVEAIPRDGADPAAVARILERFGESAGGSPKGVAVRLEHGAHELAEVVRALDSAGVEVEHLQPRTEPRRRLPRQDRPLARGAQPRRLSRRVSLAAQVGHLARRSVIRTVRQPANIAFPFIFPIALLAVTSAGLSAATKLPGFPTDSFLAFFLAFPFIQGALFATMNVGTDLARDIQIGFLNRLALTPMRGAAHR